MVGQECEYPTVSSLFDQFLRLYEEIDKSDLPTNSGELQKKIKDTVAGLIKTTVLVSEVGVFSSNETLEELSTNSVKFLLLPVLLGSLTLKRTDIERMEVLRLSNIYFRDYITRCKQYGITDVDLPPEPNNEDQEDEDDEDKKRMAKVPPRKGMPTPQELEAMARQREDKIRRFKEKKAMGERLNELKKALENPSHDEEIVRNYHITMVKKFIMDCLEELESVTMERNMLAEMAVMRMKGTLPDPEDTPKPRPLKPILITRDAMQKNVFGLGYPSLPSMTVEEFYDQRVREGWFPDPSKNQNCLQDRAAAGPDAEKEAEEKEEAEKEAAEERDDPDKIAHEREMDEWRDTHKRGWGNTYNRS